MEKNTAKEIGARLKEARTIKISKNQTEFAEFLNINQTTLSKYENGTTYIPDELKLKIGEIGINLHWLLTGQGSMEMVNPFNAVQLRGKRTIPMSLIAQDKEIVLVPFYTEQASAGNGIELSEHQASHPIPVIKDFLKPYNAALVRALEVKGDSMIEIGLIDSDVVFFVHEADPGNGIYVISINNKLLVKRIELDPRGTAIRIISENARYQPLEFKGSDIEAVKIEGKVIGWIHRHY